VYLCTMFFYIPYAKYVLHTFQKLKYLYDEYTVSKNDVEQLPTLIETNALLLIQPPTHVSSVHLGFVCFYLFRD